MKLKHLIYSITLCMALFSFSSCNDDEKIEFPPSQADVNIEKVKSLNLKEVFVFRGDGTSFWGTIKGYESPYIIIEDNDKYLHQFNMNKLVSIDYYNKPTSFSLYFE